MAERYEYAYSGRMLKAMSSFLGGFDFVFSFGIRYWACAAGDRNDL